MEIGFGAMKLLSLHDKKGSFGHALEFAWRLRLSKRYIDLV